MSWDVPYTSDTSLALAPGDPCSGDTSLEYDSGFCGEGEPKGLGTPRTDRAGGSMLLLMDLLLAFISASACRKLSRMGEESSPKEMLLPSEWWWLAGRLRPRCGAPRRLFEGGV